MHKTSYVADGINTEFIFAFPFFQASDIRVALNESTEFDASFSVLPNSEFTGGTVVFDTAPAADTKIDIFRKISLSRVIDYQPTAKIDPENLNADFNFLLAAFQDIYSTDVNIAEWSNTYDNVRALIDYTMKVIEDKVGGGAALGLYNNLLGVLQNALPALINDYGSITVPAPNENCDDYGVL